MQKKSHQIKVPGKLMIAGEYAVLEPNQSAVVMAVNRFVYAEISEAETNRVSLLNLDLVQIPWFYENNQVTIENPDKRKKFVQNAMSFALRFLEENNIIPKHFSLTIKSELDDPESGLKLGLGSSAAVVTAVVASILQKFYDPNPDKELVFKLAAMAHVETQGSGSGADVAASAYSGMLHYRSFRAEWLLTALLETESMIDLIHMKWPFLLIEPMNLPKNLLLAIGWTGNPALTKNFINEMYQLKDNEPELFQSFLKESEQAIQLFLHGINRGKTEDVFKGIQLNRRALHMIDKNKQVKIETHLLEQLADIAEQYDGAGKLSGAGGGDCGIAFITAATHKKNLMRAWDRVGIRPLEIDIYID